MAYGVRNIPYSDQGKGYQPCSTYELRLKCFSNLCILTIEGTDSLLILSIFMCIALGSKLLLWEEDIRSTILQELLGAENLFLLFGAIAILALVFVITSVPETKGLSLEEIESKILK